VYINLLNHTLYQQRCYARIQQGAGISELFRFSFGYLPQNPPHNLAAALYV
jgi:hypothetical protein